MEDGSLPAHNSPESGEPATVQQRRINRRTFIRTGLAVGGAVVAAAYVKPSLQSIGVPRAFATGTPIGGSGCTPGFWKNHFPDEWPAAYQSNPNFDTVFIVPAAYIGSLGGKTLLQVLQQGGGCEKALGRHGTAALLNAESLGKALFGLSVAEVIAIVNGALATENCDAIEEAKDALEGLNESSCPMGGKKADD